MMPQRLTPRRTGFTLLEILIATGIFMVVMVLAIGIFTLTISGSSGSEQLRINAQSARFAFESMTRDVRLAKGLVYTDPAANVPRMVIPPFDIQLTTGTADCINFATNQAKIQVYQTKAVSKTADGQNQYTITRRTYEVFNEQLTLTAHEAYSGGSAKTAAEIYDALNIVLQANPTDPRPLDSLTTWAVVVPTQNVLPTNFIADQFRAVCYQEYPKPGSPTDLLTIQPFLQLDLTVLNKRYNQTKEPQKQVKTTLRTMIVPRNFASPLEVVQPGVQGGGQ